MVWSRGEVFKFFVTAAPLLSGSWRFLKLLFAAKIVFLAVSLVVWLYKQHHT